MASNAQMIIGSAAAEALTEAFSRLSKGAGETFALVFLSEAKTASGKRMEGFQPGYVPTVWPIKDLSHNWLTGLMPDDVTVAFLPRSGWGIPGRFSIGLMASNPTTFSITRHEVSTDWR